MSNLTFFWLSDEANRLSTLSDVSRDTVFASLFLQLTRIQDLALDSNPLPVPIPMLWPKRPLPEGMTQQDADVMLSDVRII